MIKRIANSGVKLNINPHNIFIVIDTSVPPIKPYAKEDDYTLLNNNITSKNFFLSFILFVFICTREA